MSFAGDEILSARTACLETQQFSELKADSGLLFWLASEPGSGRINLWRFDGERTRRIETGNGVGSRLNGYGGGAFAVMGRFICWVAEDQSLWQLDLGTGVRLSLAAPSGARWGGLVADPHRQRWLAVREYGDQQALVAIDSSGQITVLDDRFDFYSAAALSPDGKALAWVSWQLPDMPWDRSMLCLARLGANGDVRDALVAEPPGGGSVQQPQFDDSQLWVQSDHLGWWQPFRVDRNHHSLRWTAGTEVMADHANAPWQLGERHSCPLSGGGWGQVRYVRGWAELWIDRDGRRRRVASSYSDFRWLSAWSNSLVCLARRPDSADHILRIDPDTGREEVLSAATSPIIERDWVWPETVCLPPDDQFSFELQSFLYQPAKPAKASPLIILAHGGPTSAAYATFNAQIQFWCQHGFAVADVNYTGSTGFGRAYRQALAGNWGRADVADVVRVRHSLGASRGIDPERVFIQGRSSGGYTALMAAMQPGQSFRGLGSLFGVTEPLKLKAATHRFESGYLDWLLGPPGSRGVNWRSRTPAFQAGRIACPALFFQGGKDRVVVPEQTREMVAALRAAGQCAEMVWFDEEGHGFRSPENQVTMLDTLWRFYRRLAE